MDPSVLAANGVDAAGNALVPPPPPDYRDLKTRYEARNREDVEYFVFDGCRYTESDCAWRDLAIEEVARYANREWYRPGSFLLELGDDSFKHFKVPVKPEGWRYGIPLLVGTATTTLAYLELIMWKLFHDNLSRGERRTREWIEEAQLMFRAVKIRCQVLVAIKHSRATIDDFEEYGVRLRSGGRSIVTSDVPSVQARAVLDDALPDMRDEHAGYDSLSDSEDEGERRARVEREDEDDANDLSRLNCGTNVRFLFDVANRCDEIEYAFLRERGLDGVERGRWDARRLETFRRFIFVNMIKILDVDTIVVQFENYVCERVCTGADVRIHNRKNRIKTTDPVDVLYTKNEEALGLDFKDDDGVEYEVDGKLVKAEKRYMTPKTMSKAYPVLFTDWMFEYGYRQFVDRRVAYEHFRVSDRFVLNGTNRWYPSVSEMMIGENVMQDEFMNGY